MQVTTAPLLNASERLIESAVCIPWSTAHDLVKPTYWGGMMDFIDGAQATTIHFEKKNRRRETLDDLQFLWKIALARRAMAYEEQAAAE